MSNMFMVQEEYFDLLSQIEENGGVMPEGLEEALMANEDEFTDKLENILKMIHHWEGGIAAIDLEMDRLSKLKSAKKGSIDTMKSTIAAALLSRDMKKVDLGTHKISFRKSEGVVITDPTCVPADFVVKKVSETIDKTSLKKWFKEGNTLEGAYLEERQNIQIK